MVLWLAQFAILKAPAPQVAHRMLRSKHLIHYEVLSYSVSHHQPRELPLRPLQVPLGKKGWHPTDVQQAALYGGAWTRSLGRRNRP